MWICSSYFSVSAYLYPETLVQAPLVSAVLVANPKSIAMAVVVCWGDSELHRQFLWSVMQISALAQADSSQAVQIDVKCHHQRLCVCLPFVWRSCKLRQDDCVVSSYLLQNSIPVWIHPQWLQPGGWSRLPTSGLCTRAVLLTPVWLSAGWRKQHFGSWAECRQEPGMVWPQQLSQQPGWMSCRLSTGPSTWDLSKISLLMGERQISHSCGWMSPCHGLNPQPVEGSRLPLPSESAGSELPLLLISTAFIPCKHFTWPPHLCKPQNRITPKKVHGLKRSIRRGKSLSLSLNCLFSILLPWQLCCCVSSLVGLSRGGIRGTSMCASTSTPALPARHMPGTGHPQLQSPRLLPWPMLLPGNDYRY